MFNYLTRLYSIRMVAVDGGQCQCLEDDVSCEVVAKRTRDELSVSDVKAKPPPFCTSWTSSINNNLQLAQQNHLRFSL